MSAYTEAVELRTSTAEACFSNGFVTRGLGEFGYS